MTETTMNGKTHGGLGAPKKPARDKSRDVPFPHVYFGFLAAFLFAFRDSVFRDLRPFAQLWGEARIFDDRTPRGKENVALVTLASFALFPLLGVYREVWLRWIFSPLAVSWAGLAPETAKHKKFCEQGFLAVHYFSTTALGLYVLHDKPWWPPGVGTPAQRSAISASQAEREADQDDVWLRALYLGQLAFYVLEFYTLLSTPRKQRRSDAAVYFLHHIYTVALLSLSWISYNHRIGSMVLWLHDVGDIFLPIGKMFSYAEDHIKKTRSKTYYAAAKVAGTSFFVLFVVFFAVPRLFLFGALIYQGIFEFKWYQCCGFSYAGMCGPCAMGSIWQVGLLTVLGLLYPMQVYWFYLIAKMAAQMLFMDENGDVRSDDEGEGANSKRE